MPSSLQPIPEAKAVAPESVNAAAVTTMREAMYATGGMGTPAVEMFTHDEIVTLRLIFSLFDDNGDDYLDMQELVRYSEETGESSSSETRQARLNDCMAHCGPCLLLVLLPGRSCR